MKKFFMSILKFNSKRILGIQSNLLLIVAIFELFQESHDNKFWFFLIASVLFGGMQDILDELRKSNNNK